jgi:hypothetical protein
MAGAGAGRGGQWWSWQSLSFGWVGGDPKGTRPACRASPKSLWREDSCSGRGSDASIGSPGPDGEFDDACGYADHVASVAGDGLTQVGDNYPYHYLLSGVWHYPCVGHHLDHWHPAAVGGT